MVSGGSTAKVSRLSCLAATEGSSESDLDMDLDNLVKRFWEIEECSSSAPTTTIEEDICEEHFLKNYQRLESGAYSVRLP